MTSGRIGDNEYIKTTEIVNLGSQDAQVPTYQNLSIPSDGAIGGWVGNQFIICGGMVHEEKGFSNECYKIGKEMVTFHGTMKEKRWYAASIVLTNKLWVLGGIGGGSFLSSSEYILLDGSQEDGPDLPTTLAYHAAININETHSMVIGGADGTVLFVAKTWFYLHLTGQWIDGPDLLQERRHHSVGLITDRVTEETLIVVTGGVNSGNSVEILDQAGTKGISGNLL